MKKAYKICIVVIVLIAVLFGGYHLTHQSDMNVFVDQVYEEDDYIVLVLNTTSSGLNFDSYKLKEVLEGEYTLEANTVLSGLGGKSWPQAIVVEKAQSVTLTDGTILYEK
ncbi:MAG: hypothetical protein LUG60_12550 [Erysipelotrichaceae bacterium]|nr:hypothetical protein [Erysipelotrichaceae bacterium]